MARQWTFARKIGSGFAVAVALTVSSGVISVVALRRVAASKDQVIQHNAPLLVAAEQLRSWTERKGGASRGYLLGRDPLYLTQLQDARGGFNAVLDGVKQGALTDEGRRAVTRIEQGEIAHREATERVMAMRRGDVPLDGVDRAFREQVVPLREKLDGDIRAFAALEAARLEDARAAASATASGAIWLVTAIVVVVALFSAAMALVLSRWLRAQIGIAVGQVQSSSAELQSSASQQVVGSREQVTAMSEITTTISELLATSRQIAESAQRVAQIAEQTAGTARSGDGTVDRAHRSIEGIRHHVDLVVGHMLDLGKKAQQIGSVLDIVSEMAGQTNILAINATIEAAGAGDTGKRFAVVADEIRKLADRVTRSAREIRDLIDEVRSAVNTTVMATETVSKAVDAGSREFVEVAASLKQIAGMVVTTTEAAREIELSTKQQTTAVEQVNVAMTSIALASRESETSSTQTLQTASQLASLSHALLQLVEPQAAGRA
jgi:methyl-accepting chemotaxis protein